MGNATWHVASTLKTVSCHCRGVTELKERPCPGLLRPPDPDPDPGRGAIPQVWGRAPGCEGGAPGVAGGAQTGDATRVKVISAATTGPLTPPPTALDTNASLSPPPCFSTDLSPFSVPSALLQPR